MLIANSREIGVGYCTAFVGVAMHCTLVYRLYIMARLKWQQKCANAADRGDRVESVYTRVYSIIYRCSISVHFLGVQVFLLRVNHACETNRVIAVDNNLDKPLEATMVELSRLRVDRHRVRLVAVGGEVEESSAVVSASEERLVERGVTSSIGELLQRVVGGHHEPFGVGRMLWPFSSAMKGYLSVQTVTSCSSSRNRCTLGSSRLATGWPQAGHRLATGWPQAGHGSRPTSGSRASCRMEGRCLIRRIRRAPSRSRGQCSSCRS